MCSGVMGKAGEDLEEELSEISGVNGAIHKSQTEPLVFALLSRVAMMSD